MAQKDKISNSQLWMFIVLTVIGIGIFSLPRTAAEAAGPDGWLVVFMGGLICLVDFYIISRLIKRFPSDSLIEISTKTLGKVLTAPVIGIFWLYSIVLASGVLRIFGEVVKMTLLVRTPIEVILIFILIPSLILMRCGIEPIARFDAIIFPVIIITFIIIILLLSKGCDFSNILPFMRTDFRQILKGSYKTIFSYSGFEFVLLLTPFLKNPEKSFKAGIIAFSIIIVTYLLIVIFSFGQLGIAESKHLIWPTLSAMNSVDIPASFIERLVGVAMTAWVLLAYTSIVPFSYFAALIASRALGQSDPKPLCSMVIPVIYFTAMIPGSIVEVYEYLDKLFVYLGTTSIIGIPVLLLIVSSIRKIGVKKNA